MTIRVPSFLDEFIIPTGNKDNHESLNEFLNFIKIPPPATE